VQPMRHRSWRLNLRVDPFEVTARLFFRSHVNGVPPTMLDSFKKRANSPKMLVSSCNRKFRNILNFFRNNDDVPCVHRVSAVKFKNFCCKIAKKQLEEKFQLNKLIRKKRNTPIKLKLLPCLVHFYKIKVQNRI
jgi:hypothetical protein